MLLFSAKLNLSKISMFMHMNQYLSCKILQKNGLKSNEFFRTHQPPLRTYVSSPLLQSGLIFGSPWVSLTLVWLCGFQVCGLVLALRMKR